MYSAKSCWTEISCFFTCQSSAYDWNRWYDRCTVPGRYFDHLNGGLLRCPRFCWHPDQNWIARKTIVIELFAKRFSLSMWNKYHILLRDLFLGTSISQEKKLNHKLYPIYSYRSERTEWCFRTTLYYCNYLNKTEQIGYENYNTYENYNRWRLVKIVQVGISTHVRIISLHSHTTLFMLTDQICDLEKRSLYRYCSVDDSICECATYECRIWCVNRKYGTPAQSTTLRQTATSDCLCDNQTILPPPLRITMHNDWNVTSNHTPPETLMQTLSQPNWFYFYSKRDRHTQQKKTPISGISETDIRTTDGRKTTNACTHSVSNAWDLCSYGYRTKQTRTNVCRMCIAFVCFVTHSHNVNTQKTTASSWARDHCPFGRSSASMRFHASVYCIMMPNSFACVFSVFSVRLCVVIRPRLGYSPS